MTKYAAMKPDEPISDLGDRWQIAWRIFEQATELPADQRTDFLESACEGDDDVRRAVEKMLDADQAETGIFLDRPLAKASETTEFMPPTFTRPSQTPQRLGAYRLLNKVGEGGMSSVFLAVRDDDAYQRRVVVKVIRPGMETEHVARRFRVERQILASLDHPNIARLFDGGTTDRDLPYFVMEYIDGVPIDVFCERNELSVEERLTLFMKVCAAVGYAHRNLVVHRDIKPNNILVSADGEPKLLDFGIAKLLNPDLGSPEIAPTLTATRMLTPSYASPEQIRGRMITTASDVYSLGVLLFKLLTHTLPYDFSRRSAAEIEQLVTESEPPKPSQVVTRTPTEGKADPVDVSKLQRQLAGDLDAIVLKALRSAPPKRYSTVEQMTADIDRFLHGHPVEARRGSQRYRLGKFIGRHRSALAVAGAVTAMVIYFLATLAAQSARLEVERDQARLERDKKQHVITLFEDIISFAEPFVDRGEELSVKQAVERSLPVMESRLRDQPSVRAQLLHTTGSMLNRLGSHDSAKSRLSEALELHRLHGAARSEIASTLTALASAHKHLGDYDTALSLGQEAIELLKTTAEVPNSDPSLNVAALTELVSILCYRDEFLAAEEPALEALEHSKDLTGDRRQYRMLALDLMATIKNKLGAYKESVSLRRQSLALRRELFGEDHPSQLSALSNLGLALRWSGELDAAERSYREVLDKLATIYGPEDERYAYTLNNLAGVQFARADYQAALENYEKVQEIFRKRISADHWRNFFYLVNAEASRLRLGEIELAQRRLRSGIGIWQPKLGDDHWLVAHAHSVLGEAIVADGDLEQGERLLTESYLKLTELGAKDRYRRQALDRLSTFLDAQGRAGEIQRFAAMLES